MNGKYADWGMVGLASFTRPVAVVSKYRCRIGSIDAEQTRSRLAKIAVHEIGHTFGLPHCPQPGCILQDAKGRVSICESMDDLCPSCRAKLAVRELAISAEPSIP